MDSWAQKFGPICKVFLGGRPNIAIADPELARQILLKGQRRDHRTTGPSSSIWREFKDQQIFFASGKLFKDLKGAWQGFFSPQSINTYFPLMLQCAKQLCEVLEEKSTTANVFDFLKESRKMTLEVVGKTAFGVNIDLLKSEDREEEIGKLMGVDWKKLMESISVMVGDSDSSGQGAYVGLTPWVVLYYLLPELSFLWILGDRSIPFTDREVALRKAIKEVVKDANVIVKAHREQSDQKQALDKDNKEDSEQDSTVTKFIDSFVKNDRSKDKSLLMQDRLIVAQVYFFLLAGYETTANALAYTVYLLSLYPEKCDKLAKEIRQVDVKYNGEVTEKLLDECKYLEAVIKETLRLYPPATVAVRTIDESMELLNYRIPGGSMYWVNVYGLHHDPLIWKDADKFVPERFLEDSQEYVMDKIHPYAYIPFGGGTRMCTGHRFATQELKIALYMMYRNYSLELEDGQVPLKTYVKMTMNPTYGIKVKAKRTNLT